MRLARILFSIQVFIVIVQSQVESGQGDDSDIGLGGGDEGTENNDGGGGDNVDTGDGGIIDDGNGNGDTETGGNGVVDNGLATVNALKLKELEQKLTLSNNNILWLQNQVRLINTTSINMVLNKLSNNNNILATRIKNVESSVNSNMAALKTQLTNDITAARTALNSQIQALSDDLNPKIMSTRTALEATFATMGADMNKKINDLENGKVGQLMTDNAVWRRNFRVVNATFARLRKMNMGVLPKAVSEQKKLVTL